MRWAGLFFCCLFFVVAFAGGSTPLGATDLKSPRQTEERNASDNVPREEKIAEFCEDQRQICRKICRLRFRDDDIGCPQTCVSRESRCFVSACYRWTEPEFLIAERFGGLKCFQ